MCIVDESKDGRKNGVVVDKLRSLGSRAEILMGKDPEGRNRVDAFSLSHRCVR
jgi:hypothetical protein